MKLGNSHPLGIFGRRGSETTAPSPLTTRSLSLAWDGAGPWLGQRGVTPFLSVFINRWQSLALPINHTLLFIDYVFVSAEPLDSTKSGVPPPTRRALAPCSSGGGSATLDSQSTNNSPKQGASALLHSKKAKPRFSSCFQLNTHIFYSVLVSELDTPWMNSPAPHFTAMLR